MAAAASAVQIESVGLLLEEESTDLAALSMASAISAWTRLCMHDESVAEDILTDVVYYHSSLGLDTAAIERDLVRSGPIDSPQHIYLGQVVFTDAGETILLPALRIRLATVRSYRIRWSPGPPDRP